MALIYNGERVAVADSAAVRDLTGDYLEIAGELTSELRLTELDQADPAGRYRWQVTGDTLVLQRAATAAWATATTLLTINSGTILSIGDNNLLRWGADGDIASVLRSTILGANTALASVIVGTPVTPAVAANSFILSNVTADGDVLIAAQTGGNSTAYLFIDASATTLTLYSGAGVAAITIASTGNITAAADLAVNGGDLTSSAATFNLLNATVTTLNVGGAATTLAVAAAASITTWTGRSITLTGANTTNHTTLTVTNSSNTAATAEHSIVDIGVGGATTIGDPQMRLTVPGGTSYYIGVDNSGNDGLFIGTGTAVGAGDLIQFDGRTTGTANIARAAMDTHNVTLDDGATASYILYAIEASIATFSSATTPITRLQAAIRVQEQTLTQSGGAITVNAGAAITAIPYRATASVTITHSSAFRAVNGAASTGALTNASAFYAEAMTRGTSNYQLLMANGGTEPTAAPTDHVGLYCVDIGAAAVLGIASETAVVTPAGDFALTSKLIVRVNNVSYAIGMTTTLT